MRLKGLLLLIVTLLTGCADTSVFVSPLSPLTLSPTPPLSQPDVGATPAVFHRPGPASLSPPVLLPPRRPAATPMPGTEPAVARAVADLAARLGVDPGAVEVVRVSSDDFPAQNLGCPLPRGGEPQPVQPAFVMGQEIVLAVGEQQYVYRARGGLVVFCYDTE